MKSTFLKLNLKDLIKGFITAIFMALITAAYQALEAGTISFTWEFWQPIVYSSVGAGLAYIIKNWLTNSNDDILKGEQGQN